jgi:hypothetical protein
MSPGDLGSSEDDKEGHHRASWGEARREDASYGGPGGYMGG